MRAARVLGVVGLIRRLRRILLAGWESLSNHGRHVHHVVRWQGVGGRTIGGVVRAIGGVVRAHHGGDNRKRRSGHLGVL